MTDRVDILICGDVGPVRGTLLQRRGLDVTWTDTVQDAEAALRVSKPALCFLRPTRAAGDALAFVQRQRAAADGTLIVVVLSRAEWDKEGDWLAAGAIEVVEASSADTILQLVSEYTGLRFGIHNRVPFETPIEVAMDGEALALESFDISSTGIGIRAFASVPLGTLAHLSFGIDDGSITLWARVVRCFQVDGVDCAGLRFAGMSPATRKRVSKFVDAQGANLQPAPVDYENLFEGLALPADGDQALVTADLSRGLQTLDLEDPDLAILRAFVSTNDATQRASLDLPIWLAEIADELTDIEQSALREPVAASAWAAECVGARIFIGRARAGNPRGPLADQIVERTYELFRALPALLGDADDAAVHQVGLIRATLLEKLVEVPRALHPPDQVLRVVNR